MLIPVHLPPLDSQADRFQITAWFVEQGERVEAGERLFEVGLPGITCDVRAAGSGRLARVEKAAGSLAQSGDVVGWIEALPVAEAPQGGDSA